MNIVGQLAETVYVTVKELYSGLNPATLTGGIDVIVVRQPDGSFQCSPFHVRFGKLGVLRSKEKIVDIEINGESVDLHMKLGDNGEAFFVEQNENLETEVPAHLCTSPIPLDDPEETTEASSVSGSGTRKKRRRRKRARSDSHQREEGISSSDEQDKELDKDHSGQDSPNKENHATQLQVSKSVYYSLSEEPPEEELEVRDAHRHSDGDQSPVENSVFDSRPSSPKSDSELVVKNHESSGVLMQWNWGGFPMPRHSERSSVEIQHSETHFRTIQRQDSFDMGNEPVNNFSRVRRVTVVRPQPRTQSLDLSNYALQTMPLTFDNNHTLTSLTLCDQSKSGSEKDDSEISAHADSSVNISYVSGISDTADAQTNIESQPGKESQDTQVATNVPDNESVVSAASSNIQQTEHWEQGYTSSTPVSEGDRGIDPCSESVKENGRPDVADFASPKDDAKDNEVSGKTAEELGNFSEKSNNQEQDKKKGKRNHHLGPTGIYLDDLTSLDPELAALYFPKSETERSSPPVVERGSGSGSQSPQSMGALDSGTEYLSDSASYTTEVSMSLCGCVGDTSQITKDKFLEHLVSYQDFVNNPGIVDDPSLVICINSNYYNWAVAAPMILSLTAFQKNLPKSTVESLVKDKMPKKSGRWWFSWRRRDLDNNQPPKKDEEAMLRGDPSAVTDALCDAESVAAANQKAIISSSLSTETLRTTHCLTQLYRKSLRLTSEQIENLNLREGANKVIFSVTTQYQGTCRCEAAIYLWNWDDRIIISDIDGTITKSDALGHILPQFGKDWTHKDIAKLYHKIHQNGYKFLYCSARAIGMAAITKNYLQWVNDKGTVLPKGPVLLAPSSLFSALHREVIEKKPEVFKVACLSDIRDLFNPKRQPFYAAFGNRTNDAYAYTQVGVLDTRIFTVNPKGELIQEMTKGNKSSYSHLGELVEHFFPALDGSGSFAFACPEFSSVTYWKEPLPELDLETLL
ncbi:phosphatidate phosphatase LPIN2-like isoform X1 [Corythoichthys intestinalis]|uniref:phosphatidate phosphatase LPIN2-like isoform X1 n=1 Tax=Corythoichthys intestinalis TaxID=161448 RepID=UPI0025A57BB1|nr:phosphatidate phosphatase LPIN2-like isoform X1 [Corythoichthys intestinalis]XP_057702326.1 phosphatidate phosphatase LPIN2-like isoform X1 [Corythoichthys intestinalis]XP_057702327.1 phosphatidate phosphatase LPIN2-like isoform X1 [Corythoichthys intestinalis]XP_057702328.1 phosphatidate phosphatase LPIN2-like isoform X1 [Corythoichthys intestinalis]